MFSSVGWGELLVLAIAGLVILGPERLPGAIQWTFRSIRQVRDYASGATTQLKDELGPEFEDFREPLAQLNELRGMTPRSLITKHLLDGDDSFFTGNFDGSTPIKPVSAPMPDANPTPDPSATVAPAQQLPSLRKTPRPSDQTTTSDKSTAGKPTRSVIDWDAT